MIKYFRTADGYFKWFNRNKDWIDVLHLYIIRNNKNFIKIEYEIIK